MQWFVLSWSWCWSWSLFTVHLKIDSFDWFILNETYCTCTAVFVVLYFLYKNESGLMMSQSISTEWLMLLPSTRIEHRRSVRSSFLRFGGYTEFVVYTGACPRGWYVLYYVQYNVKRCGHACRLGRLWTAFFVWAKTLKRWPFSGLFFMYVCIRM